MPVPADPSLSIASVGMLLCSVSAGPNKKDRVADARDLTFSASSQSLTDDGSSAATSLRQGLRTLNMAFRAGPAVTSKESEKYISLCKRGFRQLACTVPNHSLWPIPK